MHHVPVWYRHRGLMRVLDSLELQLSVVLKHCVGAGNRTQTFWKSSQYC